MLPGLFVSEESYKYTPFMKGIHFSFWLTDPSPFSFTFKHDTYFLMISIIQARKQEACEND